jgi:hypothetical protein
MNRTVMPPIKEPQTSRFTVSEIDLRRHTFTVLSVMC